MKTREYLDRVESRLDREISDLKKRVEKLEKFCYLLIGALGLISFLFKFKDIKNFLSQLFS